MNHSIYSADRKTHMKIVAVALACATLVASIGVFARVSRSDIGDSARVEALVPLVKAGGPISVSNSEIRVVR